MKTLKTSKLIKQQDIATSITVTPIKGAGYHVQYFLKELNKKGYPKLKRILVEKIIEDVAIPEISNHTVAHLGFKVYKFYQIDGFYINFYQF